MSETLGNILAKSRKSKGLTQSELSYITLIPRCKISQYERGRQVPSQGNLTKLLNALQPKDNAGKNIHDNIRKLWWSLPSSKLRYKVVNKCSTSEMYHKMREIKNNKNL